MSTPRRRWLIRSSFPSGLLVLATWTGSAWSTPLPVGQASATPLSSPAASAAPVLSTPVLSTPADSAAPSLTSSSDLAEGPEAAESPEPGELGPLQSALSAAADPAPAALDPAPPEAPPALWSDRYFPFLEDESELGSISIGDTSHGFLVGARRVIESDALGILPRQRARNLDYGTDQLVSLLEDAAAKYHARTRTRFWIGNVARRGGGDIAYSVSHNSGRDADIALALTDAKGAAVDPPDLLPLDAAGVSRDKEHKYRFDAARTWQIVRALVESDHAHIEFLFLARSLTEKVLRHAREKKEPLELIERAALLLHQPAGAPHDDHLHIRVYCSERDVEGGCLHSGIVRPGVRLYAEARARRIGKSVAALASESPEQRARGIERLVFLQARDHKPTVTDKLDDGESRVRAAAAAAVGHWGGGDDALRLAKKLETEADPVARVAMISALSDLGGPPAGAFFGAVLARAGTVPWGRVAQAASQPAAPVPFLLMAEAWSPLALLALAPQLGLVDQATDDPAFAMKLYLVDAAGFCDRPEPIEAMFPLLADTDPTIRAHAALSLSRLLNRRVDPIFQDPAAPPETLAKATLALTQQASPLRRSDRSPWMVEGFSRAGFKVPKIAAEHAWEILRSFGAGEPYSYNAGRALTRIALGTAEGDSEKKPPRPPVFEETQAECRYWLKWIDAHRSKLHLPKAPDNITAACR